MHAITKTIALLSVVTIEGGVLAALQPPATELWAVVWLTMQVAPVTLIVVPIMWARADGETKRPAILYEEVSD